LKIINSIKDKFLIPFRLIPKEGLTPEKMAFSITIGIIAGLFPVFGTTTFISLLLTLLFRQNLLIVQSVQWILALFQVLLIIPFMQMGAFLFNNDLHISMHQINIAFQPGIINGVKSLALYHMYAIITWSILSIPLAAFTYYTLRAVFQRKKIKLSEI
jgi:hypothetical protein